jgi:hypothetical protein
MVVVLFVVVDEQLSAHQVPEFDCRRAIPGRII